MKKKNRIIYGLLAFVFLSFAGMQYNDSDSWKWIIVYLAPSILFGLLLSGRYFHKAGRIALIIFVFSALLYIPDLWNWISEGLPSITGTMQAEEPLVEFMREFFGLVIVIIAMIYYVRLQPK